MSGRSCKLAEGGVVMARWSCSKSPTPWKGDAMTKFKIAPTGAEMKTLLLSDETGFRAVLQAALQEVLEGR